MALTLDEIVRETQQWPTEKLEELVDRLSENLHDSDAETLNAWKNEADRRAKEILSGKVETVSGEEVAARIKKQLGR